MLLSIVIPVLNEAETLPLLLARLRESLRNIDSEAIFVDDGSTDDTAWMLEQEALQDPAIRLIRFSRNFGHQAAVTAGLDFANGDAVVVMDADLQDPPELLPRMVELFTQGYDVVSPQRISRDSETLFKRWTAKLFYRIVSDLTGHRLTPEVGDFRLFSRRAVLAIRSLREQHRYMRGLAAWLGLKEAFIPFDREARTGGRTKYSFLKMMRFAWTAISSFSAFPLRVSISLGCCLSFFGFAYLLRVFYLALWSHSLVPGWASVVALQCIFSGMILLALGAIGDYVARIYEEAKNRPLYVVAETCNIMLSSKSRESLTRAIILANSAPRDTLTMRQAACSSPDNDGHSAQSSLVGVGT
ncbi:glycosyltransferase family 2 protein [Acidicapsa acidisoli]|uniref:glycosyltransferase family 2 protein n=1 Tax=Acidicapsa acidisoli TaxID=1615681 RepID=UPI0021E02E9B|nr:glycosyltransferase family 2 protein [Acidicapsa acidisoli]